jgi:hypothetical protein
MQGLSQKWSCLLVFQPADASDSKPSCFGVLCFSGNLEKTWASFGVMLCYL